MSRWQVTTPIDTFENPATGSLIDIVSTIHVADPSYYQELGQYIMSRQDEGFKVHRETIDSSPDFITTGLREKMKAKLQDARVDASVDWLLTVQGRTPYRLQQNKWLVRDEVDDQHDVTEAECIRNISLGAQLSKYMLAWAGRQNIQRAAERKNPRDFEEYIFALLRKAVAPYESGARGPRRWGDAMIIDERNRIALSGVDKEIEEDGRTNLVLVWGMGHLAGLSAGLTARGYEHMGRRDVVAASSMTILVREIRSRNKGRKQLTKHS